MLGHGLTAAEADRRHEQFAAAAGAAYMAVDGGAPHRCLSAVGGELVWLDGYTQRDRALLERLWANLVSHASA